MRHLTAQTSRFRFWIKSNLPAINAKRLLQNQRPVKFVSNPDEIPRQDLSVPLTIIQTGRNGGYAAGNNVGIRFALRRGCDFIWLLNNDTVVNSDSLHWLLKRVSEDPRIGLCGSTLVYYSRPRHHPGFRGAHFKQWKGRSEMIGMGLGSDSVIDRDSVEARLRFR